MVEDEVVTGPGPLGPLIHSFFLDHLLTVKGLRPASVRSYRDTIRLLLCFVAADKGTKVTKLTLTSASRGSWASCATWRTTVTTMSGPATSGWRPYTRYSTTSPPENQRCSESVSR